MTIHPRTVSLLVARTGLGALVLSFALVGVWMATDLWGQAPVPKKQRVEEEEDDAKTPPKKNPAKKNPRVEEEDTRKPTPKRKVIRVEEEDDPKDKNTPTRPSAPASGDLKLLAQQARHLGVQQLFLDLAVPHDHVVFKKAEHVTIGQNSKQEQEDVQPIPIRLGNKPTKPRKGLTLRKLDGKPVNRSLMSIQYVEPYETIAQKQVRAFLKESETFDQLPPQNNLHLSRYDMLVAAEQALSAVLRWHESARQTGQREGEAWAPIEASLRKQLLDDILLKQLRHFAESRDWERVLTLTRRLASSYPSKADREQIGHPVAEMLKSALNNPTGSLETKQTARKRLQDLEMEFPDIAVFQPISDELRKHAQGLLTTAKELGKGKDNLPQVRELLSQAEEIWPQLPGLRAYKIELSTDHPVLSVGVRGPLPKYLSPALACTDTERRAVEMLFESLVKLVPDDTGIFRYRPGLAEDRPTVVPLGRQFQLPRNATWSDGKTLDSTDIRATVGLLKKGVGSDRSSAWGELLDKVEVKGDPYRFTLRLNQGYVDPLALMTFKILPRHQRVDTEKFAENPVCSGPYLLDRSRQSDEKQRGCVFFVANPAYGSRSGKRDLPRIQEIRFYSYNEKEAVKEIREGNLDLVLDLTAQEAHELGQKAAALQVVVPLPSPTTPNRRIYFLAINQSRLPDASLRKALAHAINREKLLDTHFRGPLQRQVHKALNGPFPVGSWACNPALTNRQNKSGLDLYDPAKARGLSDAVRKNTNLGPYQLKYPEGDPALAKAMQELCDQVKQTTGVVLELVPCDPRRLRLDVWRTQNYDLAYCHYDFPDETYWLWPLLGPPFQANREINFLKFADDKIQPLLRTAMNYRDFAKVREYLRKLHEYLNLYMPLIPLWQLDPLLAHREDVQPVSLDPVLVFSNVAEWHLKHK